MKILIILLLLISNSIISQQYNTWIFGSQNHLKFPGPTNQLPLSSINTIEGCASISDNSGNLLFYTDGVTVWNRNHLVMTNGTGLFGGSSSTQSAIIIKQPGNTNIYYIFTTPQNLSANPHAYSVVDINLSSGLGAVTIKNVPLYATSTEHLVACMHRNNTDIWIITHAPNNNVFRAVLLTSSGITSNVISNAGINVTSFLGSFKISPQRNKLLATYFNQNTTRLYNFNNLTGVVSSEIAVISDLGPYGCEFSPDGSKFYTTHNAVGTIYQYDICNNNSRVSVATGLGNFMGTAQLTPDGRIFITQNVNLGNPLALNYLRIIQFPNNLGAACNFIINGHLVNGSLRFGLPNNIPDCPIPILTNYTYTLNCGVFQGFPPVINCAFSHTYEWFVDNISVSTNSTLNINLNANTQYNIRLRIYFQCYTYDVEQIINVNNNGGTIFSN